MGMLKSVLVGGGVMWSLLGLSMATPAANAGSIDSAALMKAVPPAVMAKPNLARLDKGQQVAATRNLYVWCREGSGYRWHGVGPYDLDEAYQVENGYIRLGYDTYIGGSRG